MTCIVAVAHEGSLIVGADTQVTGEDWKQATLCEKVFVSKVCGGTQFALGLSGQPRVLQILRYCIAWDDVPGVHAPGDVMAWVVSVLIPTMREALAAHGGPGIDGEPQSFDGNLVLGIHGHLFEIHRGWQVIEPRSPFTVIGQDQVALGVLVAHEKLGLPLSESAVRCALEAAEERSNGVGGPFMFWTVN